MYNPVPLARIALREALDKKDVLVSPREILLLQLVLAEIKQACERESKPVYVFGETVLDFYLRKGYATFQDLGISRESQNFFLEHGVLMPRMLRELEAVSNRLAFALAQGENRKDDSQHSTYIRLTHRLMSRLGI